MVNNLLARDGAGDYTALAGQNGTMQEVAQGQQADNAAVPQGTSSVSVTGSAGTSVSLAAPSLGATSGATLNGGIIVPQCTKYGITSYYATDHLGTVRFVKTVDDNTGGEVASSTHDYEPFGVEITPTDACDNTHKFTGHERDIETGNDYMHFRFFSASMGRFQKPDSNFDSPIANPQGWNLYSYVKGNPVNFNDPTGHAEGLPYRSYSWFSGDPSEGYHHVSQANALGGGVGLGGTPWDLSFSTIYGGETISFETVRTDWAAWYKSYGVGVGSSQSGVAPAPGAMLASTEGLPSALWEMFWTGITGAAKGTGDVADMGDMLLESGQAFASLYLEGLSFNMRELLNGFLNLGNFGALQRNDLFDKGVDAWNEVHNNSLGKGAFAIPASVRKAISDSSDAIMQIRQSLGTSYKNLFKQVQGWSNKYQIDWMEWYERTHML